MKGLYRILRKNPGCRSDIIFVTSFLGIAVNLALAAVKLAVGAVASSVAVIAEGVNGLTDVLTSVLTVIGTKLSAKKPDARHPSGYGKIENFTALAVAGIIIGGGAEMLLRAVGLIFHPEPVCISLLTLAVIAGSAAVKSALAFYTVKMGKKTDCTALIGVGLECRNDTLSSAITLASAAVFLRFRFSVDAYAGTLIALLMLKTGISVLRRALSDIFS